MTASGDGLLTDALAAVVRGEHVAWGTVQASAPEFLDACASHGVTGLVSQRLRGADAFWPETVTTGLSHRSRASVAVELATCAEVTAVIDALAGVGVTPIIFKGTALAYSVYDSPHLRPRGDTDLLIRRQDLDVARRTLIERGYSERLTSERLFGQVRLEQDAGGVHHAFDVHWKISSQTAFGGVLTYEELMADAIHVRGLGERARAAAPVHALLLACVHPVMHHGNAELLVWMYDIHLLASGLSASAWERFTDLAIAKRVAAICAQQLVRARARFGTTIPESVVSRLASVGGNEATSVYLASGRRWRHDVMANVRGAGDWAARRQLLRDVLFPDRHYMLRAFGLTNRRWGVMVLPALHAYRLAAGLTKVILGAK